MSDQDRISPHNIYAILSRQVMRFGKKNHLGNYKFIQYQILQTNIVRIVSQTARRIVNEILVVKGLTSFTHSKIVKKSTN